MNSTKRSVYFLAKDELWKGPKKLFINNMGLIPVNRRQKDHNALATAEKYLNNGCVIGIFPEGRTQKGRGLLSFKIGAVKMAADTYTPPIIPFIITETLFSLYGLNEIVAIANMMHSLSSIDEIKNAVISTQSKIIIVYIDMLDKVKDLLGATSIEKIIYVSPVDSLSKFNRVLYKLKSKRKIKPYLKEKRIISWHSLEQTKNYNEDIDYKKYGRDTPAVILHSGGTSGKSKNIVLQNRALILAAKQESIAVKRLQSGDSCLAIMPNFHGFGLSILMHTPLTLGCHTILVPRFSAKTFDLLLKKKNQFMH